MAKVGHNAPDFELDGESLDATVVGISAQSVDGRIAYRHVHALGLDFQTVDELREALASLPTAV
ncbi:MAG TPA: hypothetical protein VH300_15640 [Thermoleophilaceae bacterium]|nr:hypothetical protein [Thermoleophilaceae bacterium]